MKWCNPELFIGDFLVAKSAGEHFSTEPRCVYLPATGRTANRHPVWSATGTVRWEIGVLLVRGDGRGPEQRFVSCNVLAQSNPWFVEPAGSANGFPPCGVLKSRFFRAFL